MPDYHDEVTRHRKPDWLKIKLHRSEEFGEVARIVREHGLHTICSSGRCPNQAECWSRRTATFMILGDICTRSCKFCATATGKPLPPDPDEPRKLARSISLMGLKHCVVTSVDRDDLPDGGAALWAESVRAVRELNPDTTIELLIPDFDAREELIDLVADARPDILGHNIETVRRLTPQVRSRARYEVSLRTLAHIARRGLTAKSGLMVGLGETDSEVLEAVDDLVGAGVRILTIGQYLRPSLRHLPVAEYVTPEKFAWYKEQALARGLRYVESGPMVRSSYMAEKAMRAVVPQNKRIVENVTYRYVGRAEYGAVWEMQKRLFDELLEAKKAGIGAGQTLLMVEHPHVYTLGKSGHESNMLVSDEFLRSIGASYFHTDRGGDITYHGYGQLVGYPILDLERLGLSLKEYVWTVEECVIRTVAEYGIEAGRLDGATGVWIEGDTPRARKICAIGVKASRYVTMHGFALNVTTDLRYFSYINPCGFVDKGVTSVEKETGARPSLEEVARRFAAHFGELAGCRVSY